MKIGIIVAMDKEMALLLPHLEDLHTRKVNGYEFHTGRSGNREVVAVKCGIGKVNAAIATLTMIEQFKPNMIINTGVAGGTGGKARIMDVVVASRVAYHDVWCGPDTIHGQAAECPRFFVCPLPDDVVNGIPGVKRGLIASGDIFVAHREVVDKILATYPDAVAVDMESAAIAHVCHLKKVPFVCLRVISDTPGDVEDNMAQYESFWSDAPEKTFEVLKTLIQRL